MDCRMPNGLFPRKQYLTELFDTFGYPAAIPRNEKMILENPRFCRVPERRCGVRLLIFALAMLLFPSGDLAASLSSGSALPVVRQQVIKQPVNPDPPVVGKQQDEDASDSTLRVFTRAEGATFLPAPRELTRPLIRARRAIAEGEPSRAAELIGQFLIESPNDDFLIAGDRQDGSSSSLRQYAESMLGSLPESALKAYRFRFEIPARQQLDKAVDQVDMGKIADVMMRYFFTEAGQNAAMILGQHELDLGNPISAAASFNKVYQFESARKRFEPELSVLLATSLTLAGDEDYANEVLLAIRDQKQFSGFDFQGVRTPFPKATQNPNEWLASLIGKTELKSNPLVAQWLMTGGNARRNARVQPGLPFLQPVWAISNRTNVELDDEFGPIQMGRGLGSLASQRSNDMASNVWLGQPGIRAIGETIVLTTQGQSIGIDFRTGKRQWSFPGRPIVSVNAPTARLEDMPANRWNGVSNGLSGNWDSTIEASSDGSQLYWTHKLEPDLAAGDVFQGITAKARNALSCVSLKAQGRLVWTVGGKGSIDVEDDLDTEAPLPVQEKNNSIGLEEASFLGAPLPVGKHLYAICNLNQANQLVVLDRETGELIWKQHLATIEFTARNRNPIEPTISPSYANGLVICPTGTGALVAIDVATRTFQWGHQYHSPTRYSTPQSFPWRDSRVVIDGNYVVISALESNRLICLNLESGQPVAGFGKTGMDVPEGKYFACIENENAITVSRSSVAAYKLSDRTQAWTRSIREYGQPSGEGFAADGCYFLPTTERYLLKIDLSDGKILETVDTDEVLGNLVSFRGSILSFDGQHLSRFDTQQNTAREIEEALSQVTSEEELPAQINLQRSRLFALNKEWVKAMRALDLAARGGGLASEKQDRLFLLQRMLTNDIEGAKEEVDRFWDAFNEIEKDKLNGALVDYLIRKNKCNEALARLFDWERRQPMDNTGSSANGEFEMADDNAMEQDFSTFDDAVIKVDSFVIKDRDRVRLSKAQWYKTKLTLILNSAPELKDEIQNAVREQQNEAADSNSVERHIALFRFPSSAIPRDIYEKLANDLMDVGEWNRAKQVIVAMIGFDPGKVFDSGGSSGSGDSRRDPISLEAFKIWARYVSSLRYHDTGRHVLQLVDSGFLKVGREGDQAVEPVLMSLRKALAEAEEPTATTLARNSWGSYNQTQASAVNTGKYNSNLAFQVPHRDTRFSRLDSMTIASHTASRELEFFGPMGSSIQKIATPKITSTNTRDFLEIEHEDNLAIFKRGRDCMVFDLSKLSDSTGQVVLWNAPNYLAIDGIAMGQRSAAGEMAVDRANTGGHNPVFHLSVNGICRADSSNLTCHDPFTGSIRWTRPIKSNSPWLLGDDHHVVLVDHQAKIAEIYNLETGQRRKVMPLPNGFTAVYASVGARAISMTTFSEPNTADAKEDTKAKSEDGSNSTEPKVAKVAQSQISLGMYDFETETYLWEKRLAAGDKMTPLSRQRFLVFSPSGKVEIFDFVNGKQLSQLDIKWNEDELKQIQFVGSTRIASSDLIVFNKAKPTLSSINSPDSAVIAQRLLTHHVFLQGTLVLLDQETMRPKWRSPVELAGFSLVELVPAGSPMIFFQRRVQSTSSVSRPLPRSHQLFGVDFETGEERVSFIHPTTTVQLSGSMSCDSEKGLLELDLGRYVVRIQTELKEDLPPMPVAYSGLLNPLPNTNDGTSNTPLKIEWINESIEQSKDNVLRKGLELERLRQLERSLLQKEFDSIRN